MTDETESPPGPEDHPSGSPPGGGGAILDDVKALFEDGRTYAEAEFAFQQSRLKLVGHHGKWIAILAGFSVVCLVIALFALVFGAILALAPLLTPLGATGLVVAVLLALALLLGLLARAHLRGAARLFETEEE